MEHKVDLRIFSYSVYDDDGCEMESGSMEGKDEDDVRAQLQRELGDNVDIRNVKPLPAK